MQIDRCLCFRTTFAELKAVAGATGAESIAALQEHVAFGHNCRLCHPYVRRMLRTGETVFREIVTEADEPGGDTGR
ncbi:(2Fe-2S)-binding protein [Rhodocaloribacter litoris]|uniref:(2Fe-2S)-binding protein n=1 Tax=Rhodocaloribacter litoris TaxID=2558931 RepID=UPI001423CE19|nr:(2Fe-2S)-binding protein [Rhodocaloribacter litoris]GIV60083.1 MAG: (2Fe-2S)-binding protein [Rhodothermaceae bacterium]